MRWNVPVLCLLSIVLIAHTASACDTCGCAFNPSHSTDHEAAGAMITTPAASTLGRGRVSAGFLFEHQRFNSIPARDAHTLHHQGHEVHGKDHEEFYTLSLGYGVLDNLDLFMTAPIVSKTAIEVESHETLGEKDSATGFGDLRLTGKYRFWNRGADAALLLGVTAPTGETSDQRPNGDKFGIEQQPGSGAWDVTGGLAVSRGVTDHLSLASAFRYVARTEGGQDEKLGDLFNADLGVSYAVRLRGQHPNLHVLLELHTEWALRDRDRDGGRIEDSGGVTILASPGLALDLTDSLSAYWAMPVPIYQDLGGQHEELRYETIAGLTYHF